MRDGRRSRLGVVVAIGALALAGQAAVSAADEAPPPEVSGMMEALDPLVGSDWAEPLAAPEVDDAVAQGATVTEAPCAFGDQPGVESPIFRRPVRTSGHFVVTPSGNVLLVCHAAASAASFQRPLPTSAIVVDGAPCFFPDRRRTRDSHLVVTPSLHVHLTCHING